MKKTLLLLFLFCSLSFAADPRVGGVDVTPRSDHMTLSNQSWTSLRNFTNHVLNPTNSSGTGSLLRSNDPKMTNAESVNFAFLGSFDFPNEAATRLIGTDGGNGQFVTTLESLTYSGAGATLGVNTNTFPVLTLTNLNVRGDILPVVNNSGSWGSASLHPSLIYGRDITASNSVNAPFAVFTSLSAGDTIVAGTLTAASIGTNFASIVSLAGFNAAGQMFETAIPAGSTFNATQFGSSGGQQSIKDGAWMTNAVFWGNDNDNSLQVKKGQGVAGPNVFLMQNLHSGDNWHQYAFSNTIHWVEDWTSNYVRLVKYPAGYAKLVETLQQREANVWRRNFHHGTVQASTVYTNNTVTPTAANIGANAGQIQVSNGVWYLFSTPDGSALNTIKLGP